ncbi:aldo/keto reductase [Poseidonocella sp. HB161398]|uniref:aldo/keto reductase n=1 Tax=Poseidonocella sp. HB161398 TaxID=2320855 RepID=UPI0011081B9D|nr:aldo/keto reductase [Poseidonocella sp. HB161398]
MTGIPLIRAHGADIPQIGLGTWQLQGAVMEGAVAAALEAGCRHFDTAPRYENEADLGIALRKAGAVRGEIFLTTKVWWTDLAPADLIRSAERSVETLGMGPVDLLLVHWPNPAVPLEGTMEALAKAQEMGLTRHVGVSNFGAERLRKAAAACPVPLAVNQCEYHPQLDQSALIAACRELGIAFEAYAPLGSGNLLADPVLAEIAERMGRSPAQVLLRWHLQQGVIAIPRSSNPGRVAQNFAVGDFELPEADMAALHALATPEGRHFNPDWVENWD